MTHKTLEEILGFCEFKVNLGLLSYFVHGFRSECDIIRVLRERSVNV